MGIDNLITIDEPTRRKVFERAQRGGGGVNSKDSAEGSKKAWGVGEMEFEAHMRMLDNAVRFIKNFDQHQIRAIKIIITTFICFFNLGLSFRICFQNTIGQG